MYALKRACILVLLITNVTTSLKLKDVSHSKARSNHNKNQSIDDIGTIFKIQDSYATRKSVTNDDNPFLLTQNLFDKPLSEPSHHQEQASANFKLLKLSDGSRERHLFRIGLIVPKTAFVSLYKTYTQRIKDTFAHLLQLSRHQHQKTFSIHYDRKRRNSLMGNTRQSATYSNQNAFVADNTRQPTSSLSSCLTRESPLSQKHRRVSLPNLTFNQYFDIEIVNLVNLAPRSSAQDIISSMCQKLIEQNVSVIIYLENNHDISSLDSQTTYLNPEKELSARPQIFNLSAKDRASSSRIRLNSSQGDKLNGEINVPEDVVTGQIKQSEPMSTDRSSNEVQQTSSQAHFIMHLAHSAGIPMIAWSMSAALAQRPKKRRTLHLAPTVAHEAKAMLAIMDRYSWYSFSVVTTTLVGYDDFILAFKQSIAAAQSTAVSQNSNIYATKPIHSSAESLSNSSSAGFDGSHGNNTSDADSVVRLIGRSQMPEVSARPSTSKAFRLVDVVTIKRRSIEHIENVVRQLTFSESRVILLYASKGEAMDILKVARKLKLTTRGYAWIVAQSVIGPDDGEEAPLEFHPGLLGIYFRSNHERLLDELSRAITIIAHGLEKFVRDENSPDYDNEENLDHQASHLRPLNDSSIVRSTTKLRLESDNNDAVLASIGGKEEILTEEVMINSSTFERSSNETIKRPAMHRSMIDYRKKLLSVHSRCQGGPNQLSEKRGDLLYKYFRKSSPTNVFDADGSLKDVELSVVNLDNERRWRKIGCFLDETLTIDDITWPEQAERPPSGTMEKFHLRAVFLEEPSFVNLADPDVETGECKTNRAVRCRYKALRTNLREDTIGISNHTRDLVPVSNQSSSSRAVNQTNSISSSSSDNEFEYKCCSGFCIDLMEKFATDLKFTYDLYRVPDGLWGVLENNTWNGLIEEVIKSRADIVISSLKINSDRQKAVDFTVPFLDTGISILVSKQTGVISKLAFLEPFDRLAWIMFICVGIPLAAVSIFYFELLSPNGFYSEKNDRFAKKNKSGYASNKIEIDQEPDLVREHHKFSFCRTLWLVITILFGSAAHIDSPKGYTARFMSNVWATFAVVFLAVYTANLAAFMITREEYLELSGISDPKLAYPYHRHPPLRFGTIAGGNTHAVLSMNKPNLYDYMRKYNRLSVEEGIESVRTGQLDAFIYDSLVLDYLAGQDPECKLVNVGSWYSMTGYALAFPRNSRYYDKFNMKMLEFKKNGELDRLRRFWLQGLCKPGQTRHSISKPLDLSQFMSAFLLLGAGILCSVLILTCEHLYAIYLRDILIKSRHRKRLIELLYPFSLSLADSLRLPSDMRHNIHLSQRDHQEGLAKGEQPSEPYYIEETTACIAMDKLRKNIEVTELDDHLRGYAQGLGGEFSCLANSRLGKAGSLSSHRNWISDATIVSNATLGSLELQLVGEYEKLLMKLCKSPTVKIHGHNNNNEFRQATLLVDRLKHILHSLSGVRGFALRENLSANSSNYESGIIRRHSSHQNISDTYLSPSPTELTRSDIESCSKRQIDHKSSLSRNYSVSYLCETSAKRKLRSFDMSAHSPRGNGTFYRAKRLWSTLPKKSDPVDNIRISVTKADLSSSADQDDICSDNLDIVGNSEILL